MLAPEPAIGARPAFREVDADDADDLVAMMDATDAWPTVVAVRRWVLDRVGLAPGARVVDVGCGPGTFATQARARGARTVELDRSTAMLRTARARHPGAVVVRADLAGLPLVAGAAGLVRTERVLQWSADPSAALVELRRLVGPGGWLAVTDTDWTSFAVDLPDGRTSTRLASAARRWVPHPGLASSVEPWIRGAGPTEVVVRRDLVTLDAWDPDDPAQADGPPGLPLRRMAAVTEPVRRSSTAAEVVAVAQAARTGRFRATLELVTVLGRFADGADPTVVAGTADEVVPVP